MNPLFALTALAFAAPRYSAEPPLDPADLWTPLPTHILDVGGIDVSVMDSGGDGHPLLLIHGLSSYGSYWADVLTVLPARGYRVITVDLPGYGRSARPPDAPYTPSWYATVMVGLLDALDIPSATVFGHSMGGQIALTMALDFPARVTGLVLSAPAGFERFSPGEVALMQHYWTPNRALHTTEVETRAAFTTAVFRRHDDLVERWIGERVRMGRHPSFVGTSLAVSRCIAGMLSEPVWDRLPSLSVPTLIVFGEQDAMIPNPVLHGGRTRTVAEAGAMRIPGARLVLLPDAGHTVHHDDPDGFLAAALSFVDEVSR